MKGNGHHMHAIVGSIAILFPCEKKITSALPASNDIPYPISD